MKKINRVFFLAALLVLALLAGLTACQPAAVSPTSLPADPTSVSEAATQPTAQAATQPPAAPEATTAPAAPEPTTPATENPTAPTAQPAPLPAVNALPNAANYRWEKVWEGFDRPLLVTHAGDGSGRVFIVEQQGVIRVVENGQLLPTPFLDIRDIVNDNGNEQGLLGLAFHPRYAENGLFFIYYTADSNDSVVARVSVRQDDRNQANRDSLTGIMFIVQPYANHNGGHLTFGPDGFLYIGLGDGGSAGDPGNLAQYTNIWLGSILRIDINSDNRYEIPADNPFAPGGINPGGGLAEIWAYGLRNPWRFSFDRATGDLYIGDVGQNKWEEIHYLPAAAPGQPPASGANLGWDYYEGTHAFEGNPPAGMVFDFPIAEYDHASGGCSITGGVVYRGPSFPDWQGVYLYGDFCSGKIWGLVRDASGTWQNQLLFESRFNITSFGEDEAGEVYVVSRNGMIYRLAK